MFVLRGGFGLRLALIADLFFFTVSLILFSFLPLLGDITTNPLTSTEVFVGAMGVPALVGLFGRLFSKPHIPLNEWAYAYTGFYTVALAAIFFTVSYEQAEWTVNLLLAVIFTGIFAAAFGAHILDGSKRPLAPLLNRRYALPRTEKPDG